MKGRLIFFEKLEDYFRNILILVLYREHWLDITYGVTRIEGESLSDAIGRTPTYQKNSVPQLRYVTEDIPTGLVPLEVLGRYLDVDCSAITKIIDEYESRFVFDVRKRGRNLLKFDKEYIIRYLKGEL